MHERNYFSHVVLFVVVKSINEIMDFLPQRSKGKDTQSGDLDIDYFILTSIPEFKGYDRRRTIKQKTPSFDGAC